MKKLPFLLITLFFLSACVDDEPKDEVTLTSEEAIASLEAASAQMGEDILDLLNSDGMYSMIEASYFMDHFLGYSSNIRADQSKEQLLNLYNFFVKKPVERVRAEDPNTNESPSGLFEWDPINEKFVHNPEYDGTDLILLFPVGDSESNNGKFRLVEMTETDSGLPESIELYVYIDDNLMVELNLNINWSSYDFPEDGEVFLFMKPFTLVAQYNLTDGLDTTLSVTLAKGDEQLISIGLSADSQSIFNGELPEITGHIEYRWVKFHGSVDLQGMGEAFEAGADPNEHLSVDLELEGEKVGEVILILETGDDGYTDYYPYIEFLDGELLSLDDLLEEMLVNLEEELNSHSL